MATAYHRLTYVLPAELEEEVTARLWEAATLGIQTREEEGGLLRLEAWFPAPGAEGWRQPGWPEDGERAPRLLASEVVAGEDWLAAYRRQAAPFPVAERFYVDPGEPDGALREAPAGRWLLRLPARSAFGTGSHESTRLVVELLEAAPPAGLSVLDVGTGTGILAFAALLLGARRAVGVDLDPAAALIARQNLRLNLPLFARRRPAFFAGGMAALAARASGSGARFDLALVNIVPEQAAGVLAEVAARLTPGGGVIVSGLLAEQAPEVLGRLARLRLRPRAERSAGGWLGLRLVRG